MKDLHTPSVHSPSWRYLLTSIFCHAVLLTAALFLIKEGSGVTLPTRAFVPKAEPKKVVQAKAVDSSELKQEIARLNQIERAREDRQEALRRQAERLQQQRREEETRLQALKAKQAKVERQAKKAQEAERKRLADLEEKNKALQAQKRQQERALAEAKKAREAEEQKAEAIKQEQARARQLAAEKLAADKAAAAKRQQESQQREAELRKTVDKFGLLVKSKVTQNWIVQGGNIQNACVLSVRLGPGGIVLGVEVLQTSGSDAMDRSAIAAIYKSSPLPVPEDEDAFERMRDLRLTLKPEDILTAG